MKHHRHLLGAFALLLATIVRLDAALNAYLELTLNGTDVIGEPTVQSMGGVDVSSMIECVAFEWESVRPDESGRVGRMTIRGLKFVHRLGKSSPLLAQGMANNEVAEGTFHFFQRNPDTGETELFYTIAFSGARVVQVRDWVPNTLDPAGAPFPPMEEVQILAATLILTHPDSGTETVLEISPAA